MTELLYNHARGTSLATLLLAHGAGAPMDSEFMEDMAALLAERGITVARFEFPYMQRRRASGVKSPPDRGPRLLECFRDVIDRAGGAENVFIGGKSLGGRMATMVATELPVKGVVCLGYPFHPPGKPEKTRLDHFPELRSPVLICQGERDPFGTHSEVEGYSLAAGIDIHWLPDGDHSLKPRKKSGITERENLESTADAVADFCRRRK